MVVSSKLLVGAVRLVHPVKWQRVEKFVVPVVRRVVDVRVLTQILTQRRRFRVLVGAEVGRPVQRHQNDQTLLALLYDVVMKCSFKFEHTESAVNTRS